LDKTLLLDLGEVYRGLALSSSDTIS